MRDPKRIRPFLDEVAKVWEEHPDLRFGQLVMDVMPGNDRLWNTEDGAMLKAFQEFGDGVRHRADKEEARKQKSMETSKESESGYIFSVQPSSNKHYLDIWFSADDGQYYMKLDPSVGTGTHHESMILVSNILMAFTKWMVFMGYSTDEEVDLSEYLGANIWFWRGHESIEKAYAVFKAYAVGYMSGLPQDEFLHSVNFNIFHLAELNELLEDEELKDILHKVKKSYPDFYIGMLGFAHKSEDNRSKLIKYIADNPEACASDIVEFVGKLL
ncbi:MAG: hypothetical protein E7301_00155 [Butyrivibrio sp.]|jgi:hypothetical protein|nr:hypothetical protein [Butyrivibrio sp.]